MISSPKLSRSLKHASALLFFVAVLLIAFFGTSVQADHTEQFKGRGFAYGSMDDNGDGSADTGIGYISFGCEGENNGACAATATDNFPTGYGVRINTNPESPDEGKFFGYAWSSNYGWISFYQNDVTSCGSEGGVKIPGDVQSFIHTPGATASLSGYARVLNNDNSYWDGCIKFSGEIDDGSQYGTKIQVDGENLTISGWAWGSELIGWVSFDCEYCNVSFSPIDEECPEADDSEECAEDGPQGGIALYVGSDQSSPIQIVGNSTYSAEVTDIDLPQNIKLIPQSFGQDVDSCVASASATQNASIAGWSGVLASLNPLEVDNISNQFIATISNHQIGEIVTFNIDCMTVGDGQPVSAEAFVVLQYPEASVSITANPNPVDASGTTTLSWTFDNVQDNSCEITGEVDTTPGIDGDGGVIAMSQSFADTIGFASWSPDAPGSDDLFGISAFPIGFEITCQNYANQPVSDIVYLITEWGCTQDMEDAGWCSNDINPIFEEF